MPLKFFTCGAEVQQEGANYYCTGALACPAQVRDEIIHYAAKGIMNIEELGEKRRDSWWKRAWCMTLPTCMIFRWRISKSWKALPINRPVNFLPPLTKPENRI